MERLMLLVALVTLLFSFDGGFASIYQGPFPRRQENARQRSQLIPQGVIGCDSVLSSGLQYDKCGVCNGDNTKCRIMTGLFDSNDVDHGYHEFAVIPSGAMYINVTELTKSRNYLALQGTNGNKYINMDWKIDPPGNYSIAGTFIIYKRAPGRKGIGEQFLAKGPTTEDLRLIVISQQRNPGISYEYSLPKVEPAVVDTPVVDTPIERTPDAPSSTTPAPPQQLVVQNSKPGSSSTQIDEGVSLSSLLGAGQSAPVFPSTGSKYDPDRRPEDLRSSQDDPVVPEQTGVRPPAGKGERITEANRQQGSSEAKDDPRNSDRDEEPQPQQQRVTPEEPQSDSGGYPAVNPYRNYNRELPNPGYQQSRGFTQSETGANPSYQAQSYPNTEGNPPARPVTGIVQPSSSSRDYRPPVGKPNGQGSIKYPNYNQEPAVPSPNPNPNPYSYSYASGGQPRYPLQNQQNPSVNNQNPNFNPNLGGSYQNPGQYGLPPSNVRPDASAGDGRYPVPPPSNQRPNQGQPPYLAADGSADAGRYNPQDREPAAQPLYGWREAGLTECSVSCAGGIQFTNIECIDWRAARPVDSSLCNSAQQMPRRQLACNMEQCPPVWEVTEWMECSRTCGTGRRMRQVSCRQRRTASLSVMLPAENCDPRLEPARVQDCQTEVACTEWKTEDWEECDVSCGEGKRQREVTCIDESRQELDESQCANEAKPEAETSCQMGSCVSNWFVSEWNDLCSAECGGGHKNRYVVCSTEGTSRVLLDEDCKAYNKPRTSRTCNNEPCGAVWLTSEWGQCSTECGDGIQTRMVLCAEADEPHVVVNEEQCSMKPRPPSTQGCRLNTCAAVWFNSDWSQCSRTCGGGQRRREVKCLDSEMLPSTHCDEGTRPDKIETCNVQQCSTAVPESGCRDNFNFCQKVAKARFCTYSYYKNNCCYSCFNHR